MQEELLEQLDTWHEEDEYEQIVEAILEVPEDERDYILNSHLGRAYNNLEQYVDAVEVLSRIADEGQEDPLWHYRIGMAYYYLERYEEAKKAFEASDRLEPEDEDTLEFLELIDQKLLEEQPEDTAAAVETSAAAAVDSELDLMNFWDDSEHALEQYVLSPPTDEQIASVEEELVFKLPASYVQMMKLHNGGVPSQRYYPAGTSGAAGFVEVAAILGIGRDKPYSLCGEQGSRSRVIHENYPEFGVIIGECTAPGEVIMLDYRPSGNDGEPEVVHVNKDQNFKVTHLAPDFASFVKGLMAGPLVSAEAPIED
ncbi:SMI1/KNR4 family protein [Paenibacillus sp. JX-17]|uniref:SMI1/KNR4 family protein n=1 Tax=Paenibacillus lacisoli TaxID=3064525 RepID=A0ABT9CAG2_9BACL|nr:SMI1/KNR4 family protein [Paenibacillus sp. JX-17]MDO7906254.1 SMI1/KNR4 family protein [Paenibacillus sp. JX-17]